MYGGLEVKIICALKYSYFPRLENNPINHLVSLLYFAIHQTSCYPHWVMVICECFMSLYLPQILWSLELQYLPPAYAIEVIFSSCLCVCVCVCVWLSLCVSVRAITFEQIDIETSFLVWCYILTISRSNLSIKFIGSNSRSSHGKC